MNLPNKITSLRLIITVAFVIVLFIGFPYHETVALLLFGIGSITDHLDGHIARKYNLITDFGKLMDSLADKIFTCSAFIAFVGMQKIAAWMVVVIVARELAITGLRTLAASKNIILAAEKFGKHKTVSQIVCILMLLISISYKDWGAFGQWFKISVFNSGPWMDLAAYISTWVTVAFTIWSGGRYLWRNRAIYLSDI